MQIPLPLQLWRGGSVRIFTLAGHGTSIIQRMKNIDARQIFVVLLRPTRLATVYSGLFPMRYIVTPYSISLVGTAPSVEDIQSIESIYGQPCVSPPRHSYDCQPYEYHHFAETLILRLDRTYIVRCAQKSESLNFCC